MVGAKGSGQSWLHNLPGMASIALARLVFPHMLNTLEMAPQRTLHRGGRGLAHRSPWTFQGDKQQDTVNRELCDKGTPKCRHLLLLGKSLGSSDPQLPFCKYRHAHTLMV